MDAASGVGGLNEFDYRRFKSAIERISCKATLVAFGDTGGYLLFLGALVYFGLYWRIGIFVSDNLTLANTLIAVADGQLYLDRIVYGPSRASTPGLHFVDGRAYGRNYGQVFLALPVLAVVEGVAAIADLRIAIAGAWSLLLLAFAARLGTAVNRRTAFVLLGSAGALVAFGLNVAFAMPLDSRFHYLIALQLTSMLAAAMTGVLCYRLLAAIYDARVGTFVGATTVLATPVAFWAPVPKRHSLTAMLAVLTLFAFYVSRTVESDKTALRARCTTYACVGFTAWVHAAEGLVLLAVLVPFDLATARSNDPRRMTVVATVSFLSLLPFFLTNQLIAGNPLEVPRLLPSRPPSGATELGDLTPVGTATADATPGASSPGGPPGVSNAGATAGPTMESSGGDSATAIENGTAPSWVSSLFHSTVAKLAASGTMLARYFGRGIDVIVNDPSRVFNTFIRSSPSATRATSRDLSLLEATPLFGVLVAAPLLVVRRWWPAGRRGDTPISSLHQTDLFAIAYVLALTLLYVNRLPTNATWTVRYLLPVVPFGMYFVGRLGFVRQVVAAEPRALVYSYAGLVLIGGQLLVVFLSFYAPTLGEAIRLHAVLGIVAAAIVGGWGIGMTLDVIDDARLGAVALAIPLAIGTLFVLLTGMEYFVVESFALGMIESLSDTLPIS